MKVPCPLPLQSPWSPVGYHVVETDQSEATGGQAGLPPATAAKSQRSPDPVCTPWSPVGCRVVQVAAERVPVVRSPFTRSGRTIARGAEQPASAFWGVAAVVGAFCLFILLPLLLAGLSSPPRTETPATFVWTSSPTQDSKPVKWKPAGPPQVALPADAADLPVRDKSKHVPLALPAGAVAAAKGAECVETFGTTVAFAPNPSAAAALASKANKLTFVLHVSGNFEESKFT